MVRVASYVVRVSFKRVRLRRSILERKLWLLTPSSSLQCAIQLWIYFKMLIVPIDERLIRCECLHQRLARSRLIERPVNHRFPSRLRSKVRAIGRLRRLFQHFVSSQQQILRSLRGFVLVQQVKDLAL